MLRIKSLMIFLLMISFFDLYGQGLKFEEKLSWKEVQEKARNGNKYIFLDVFATWCGPCKRMDAQVYSKNEVGNFMNEKFISVKVQVDKTASDNDYIKSWYDNAAEIGKKYGIRSYPTFIFLSPNGELIHKSGGYREPDVFIQIVQTALDPAKNIAGAMDRFRKRMLDQEGMIALAFNLLAAGDQARAEEVAKVVKDTYLEKLPLDSLVNRTYLNFIAQFAQLVGPNDRIFKVFYDKPQEVDKITYNGYSQRFVDYIIKVDVINPRIWKDKKPVVAHPDWKDIHKDVAERFGRNYADRGMNAAKIEWYKERKDWDSVAKYFVEKVENYNGIDTASLFDRMELNNTAYRVFFTHINNKQLLDKVTLWIKPLAERTKGDYNLIDTYASLLYKKGQKKEALVWEQKALEFASKSKNNKAMTAIKETIEKMKNDEPTW